MFIPSFTESAIGFYFLIAIVAALTVSVALLIWKGSLFKSTGQLDHPFCRETTFLVNNLLFVSFCFVVLLGTIYPLIVEAIRGVKISVPFFNQMSIPLALAIILLMGIGVILPWRKSSWENVRPLLIKPILIAIGSLVVAWAWFKIHTILVLLTIAFSAFTLSGSGEKLESRTPKVSDSQAQNYKKQYLIAWCPTHFGVRHLLFHHSLSTMIFEMGSVEWKRGWIEMFRMKPRRYGGFISHIGLLVIVLGVASSGNYQLEKQVSLKLGESLRIGSQHVQLVNIEGKNKAHRFELIADVLVLKKGKPIDHLQPKLNFYSNNREPIGSPAIRSTPFGDLYLTLMAFEKESFLATFRILSTPGVVWIWLGCGILVLGVWISLGFREET